MDCIQQCLEQPSTENSRLGSSKFWTGACPLCDWSESLQFFRSLCYEKVGLGPLGALLSLEIFWTPQELCEITSLGSIPVISIPRKEKALAEAGCLRPSWLVRLNAIFLTLAFVVIVILGFYFAFSQKDEFYVLLADINCLTAVSSSWQASTVVRSSPEVTSYSWCLKPAYPD